MSVCYYIYTTYSGDFEGLCVEGSDLQVQGDVVDEFDDTEDEEETRQDEQDHHEPVHPGNKHKHVLI